YGSSARQPELALLPFIKGVEAKLSDLQIDKFYVIGVSGGNPAAVSATAHFGDRVLALGSVCGLAPFREAAKHFPKLHRRSLMIAQKTPAFVLQWLLNPMVKKFRPEERIEFLIQRLHPKDREVLQDQSIRTVMLESMHHAREQGSHGILFDLKTFSDHWPVD